MGLSKRVDKEIGKDRKRGQIARSQKDVTRREELPDAIVNGRLAQPNAPKLRVADVQRMQERFGNQQVVQLLADELRPSENAPSAVIQRVETEDKTIKVREVVDIVAPADWETTSLVQAGDELQFEGTTMGKASGIWHVTINGTRCIVKRAHSANSSEWLGLKNMLQAGVKVPVAVLIRQDHSDQRPQAKDVEDKYFEYMIMEEVPNVRHGTQNSIANLFEGKDEGQVRLLAGQLAVMHLTDILLNNTDRMPFKKGDLHNFGNVFTSDDDVIALDSEQKREVLAFPQDLQKLIWYTGDYAEFIWKETMGGANENIKGLFVEGFRDALLAMTADMPDPFKQENM